MVGRLYIYVVLSFTVPKNSSSVALEFPRETRKFRARNAILRLNSSHRLRMHSAYPNNIYAHICHFRVWFVSIYMHRIVWHIFRRSDLSSGYGIKPRPFLLPPKHIYFFFCFWSCLLHSFYNDIAWTKKKNKVKPNKIHSRFDDRGPSDLCGVGCARFNAVCQIN